ncbi:beta-glucuronidase [Vallitalea longa]|uniref:Beta-glucuronidase n=1 Tax=Vallitalea longa TaxID=2936439 RepID=A0A9W5YE39_9FIRM|nr:beta-glucuronidase [Vallitalea longa]GKX30653.1 beta-glucuronidase [Vallitalea longa]
MLYPIDTLTRQVKELNGIWRFKLGNGKGLAEKWYEQELTDTVPMPVPASYNDIYEDKKYYKHIGFVWYEKKFMIPDLWKDKRIVIRIGSATHNSIVWINGKKVIEHVGGYTPFEGEISDEINFNKENRITIAVNNILDLTTIPIGQLQFKSKKYKKLKYYFDFFNYSGIHRPVKLYITPKQYIEDVEISTLVLANSGIVSYSIKTSSDSNIDIEIIDNNEIVANASGYKGEVTIDNPTLWEPNEGYLYTFRIKLIDEHGNIIDTYDERFGIRSIKVKENQFLINNKPFYFKGFGKHEDNYIIGRGYNDVFNIKDFSLMKWIGANSFRTSHYPYSEEIMRLADEEGIVVIDESPAVGLNLNIHISSDDIINLDNGDKIQLPNTWDVVDCQKNHLKVMEELINRDKNHPSVVMWSIANEPASEDEGAYEYFKPIVELTKKLDPYRPVTIVEYQGALPFNSRITNLIDVITLNRYYGWYIASGDLDYTKELLRRELIWWWDLYNKPIMMTEYGTDTILGLTSTTSLMWTEEYQEEFLKVYHEIFDELDFFIGEHVWNFADFATDEDITRVNGNKKGIFTRNRKPKKAAYLLKNRWNNIPNYGYK